MRFILLAVLLLAIAGCGRKTQTSPNQIGQYKFGAEHRPSTGGILHPVSVGTLELGRYRPMVKLYLTPAGHKIRQITLIFTEIECLNAPDVVKNFLSGHFGCEFKAVCDAAESEIPPVRITVRRDTGYGPNGVRVELVHTGLAAEGEAELKRPEIIAQIQREELAGKQSLIEEALEVFAHDCGGYPLSLIELEQNLSSRQGWNGPYLDELPRPSGYEFRYRQISDCKYSLEAVPAKTSSK